ncbi:hypothetical protein NQ315_014609 [Exocentrus adspersus]|uniref:Myb/SANT-like DNA-binding domain-containing protein n=1 Tax=Exocentrus adspersus TaxID=1586481 RepID=A0AAV8VQG4_9CUCU|nr:hypothetical protein NQ315_014609 [Exocentrus adspersus]
MDEPTVHQELREFSLMQSDCKDGSENFFTKLRIQLIALYKKYKPRLGTTEVRSMKKMFQHIARDMSNIYKVTISADKVENKWKVLERTYKKVNDNNNKTGRGRKIFDFEDDFDEIFEKKRVLHQVFSFQAIQ